MTYQGMVTNRAHFALVLAAATSGTILAAAQTVAAPANPAQTASPAPRNRVANPANAGRLQLDQYLDGIAAQYTASRGMAVAQIHTRAQAEARQIRVRSQILSLIGAMPARTPLNQKILGETQADGFKIRKVIFESQPKFFVTALLYVPDGNPPGGKRGGPGDRSLSLGSKRAAILMTPGHGPSGKAGDAPTAAIFAQNGFVVLSYDPIGQGERLQYPDPAKPGTSLAARPTGEHGEASLQPMLIGETFAKYEIWDAMRGVDYLASLPFVDPHRIGAMGCSGGGTVTALTSALDTRIAAIGTACYITSFDALLPSLGPQDAEQSTPRFISSGLDFPDWVELAAPRPYAVLSTYSDMFSVRRRSLHRHRGAPFLLALRSGQRGTPSALRAARQYHRHPQLLRSIPIQQTTFRRWLGCSGSQVPAVMGHSGRSWIRSSASSFATCSPAQTPTVPYCQSPARAC